MDMRPATRREIAIASPPHVIRQSKQDRVKIEISDSWSQKSHMENGQRHSGHPPMIFSDNDRNLDEESGSRPGISQQTELGSLNGREKDGCMPSWEERIFRQRWYARAALLAMFRRK
jgi:hypothetical protein